MFSRSIRAKVISNQSCGCEKTSGSSVNFKSFGSGVLQLENGCNATAPSLEFLLVQVAKALARLVFGPTFEAMCFLW